MKATYRISHNVVVLPFGADAIALLEEEEKISLIILSGKSLLSSFMSVAHWRTLPIFYDEGKTQQQSKALLICSCWRITAGPRLCWHIWNIWLISLLKYKSDDLTWLGISIVCHLILPTHYISETNIQFYEDLEVKISC